MHAEARALGLEFGHRLGGHGVVDLHLGAGFENLAGIELDHVAAGFLGLGDRFKGGEFLEGVGLATDEPAVLAEVLGNRIGVEIRGESDGEKSGEDAWIS